jgi:hypothetical protein
MDYEDKQNREREVQDRIANFMRAEGDRKQEVSAKEQQLLKDATDRLNQLLSASAEADARLLRVAAARLDQLLTDIAAGKDVVGGFKQRRESEGMPE